MSKVYQVSSGNYDDFTIHGLYISLEKAMEYVFNEPFSHEKRIDEYEVDDTKPTGNLLYVITMNGEGETLDIHIIGEYPDGYPIIYVYKWRGNIKYLHLLQVYCYASDPDKAIEIVNQIRLKELDSNE